MVMQSARARARAMPHCLTTPCQRTLFLLVAEGSPSALRNSRGAISRTYLYVLRTASTKVQRIRSRTIRRRNKDGAMETMRVIGATLCVHICDRVECQFPTVTATFSLPTHAHTHTTISRDVSCSLSSSSRMRRVPE